MKMEDCSERYMNYEKEMVMEVTIFQMEMNVLKEEDLK